MEGDKKLNFIYGLDDNRIKTMLYYGKQLVETKYFWVLY